MNKRLLVIVGVASLLFGGWYLATPRLDVTSEPAGADVVLNGRWVGRTPLQGHILESGRLGLQVGHAQFAPYQETLDVELGARIQRKIKLEPGVGQVRLLSNPREAWVEIDGERQSGLTPMTLELASGQYQVTMGRDERRAQRKTVLVKDGADLTVNLELPLEPYGSLRLDIKPAGTRVELVGTGLDYRRGMRLPIGEYPIRVSKAGYQSQSFRFRVRYGENIRPVTLLRDYAPLRVRAEPDSALVDVVYSEQGSTHVKRYTPNIKVPVGAVELRVRAMGRRSEVRRLNVGSAGASLNFRLEPLLATAGSEFADALARGGNGPRMVVIPAGSFTMGDDAGPISERPARTVLLSQPFAVSKYEISVQQIRDYAQATGVQLNEQLAALAPQAPASNISYEQAQDYARWLEEQTGRRYRLLTESEWEYVARAGSTTAFAYGNDPNKLCEYGNIGDLTAKRAYRTWDVTPCDDGRLRPDGRGQYRPNALGVYDLYGNVAEWVAECGMPSYAEAGDDGSVVMTGTECSSHGYRGGSWDSLAMEASSTYRNVSARASDDRGIRLLGEL